MRCLSPVVILALASAGAAPAADGDPGTETASKGPARKPVPLWSDRVPLAPDAGQYFIAPDGTAGGMGTKESPWDWTSVAAGQKRVPPGSVVWVRGGRYEGTAGGKIALSGAPGKPVHLRAAPGERATLDGGQQISGSHLWIWELEMAGFQADWRPDHKVGSGSGYQGHVQIPGKREAMVTGGDDGTRYIGLVIHNNGMGVGYWKSTRNSEMHGCIIYDNGFDGTDRPHGPGIYTQNTTGTLRLITDNIIAGNFSTGMQMYGSKIDEQVNDYLVEGNVWFAPRVRAGGRNYILCGGEKSRNIAIKDNILYGYNLKIGSGAGQICEGNTLIHASLGGPASEKNREMSGGKGVETFIRPNKYDPRRAHLVVINWPKGPAVPVDLSPFVEKGQAFRILDALDYFGKPLATGFHRGPVTIPMPPCPWPLHKGSAAEFWVFVVMKE